MGADAAAAHRPTVGTAANGVPTVNIVAPDALGLSHNQYAAFNVATPGLVLNNSNQPVQRSQLGGVLTGNPRLRTSGPARVILNEVTQANRSVLAGVVEVHGQGAEVIIANPHGVTCNGRGFINPPRVTLSTGRPQVNGAGGLTHLTVDGGEIHIKRRGDQVDTVSQFDLVSRHVRIDGPVQAGQALSVVAGRNGYAYRSGHLIALPDEAGAAGADPAVAIDTSLLGSLHAGTLYIISIEHGAGVRLHAPARPYGGHADDMALTAGGRLVLNSARSKTAITATATRDAAALDGTVFAAQRVTVNGATDVTVDENALVVASQGDVQVQGTTVTLGNNAVVAAGANTAEEQSASGTLTVTATTVRAGAGQLSAGERLHITAPTIDLQRVGDVGTGNAEASDTQSGDTQVSNVQVGDSGTSGTQAGHAQAGDTGTSDAQASDAQASDAQASDAQASHAQASDAQASHA